MNIHDYLSYGTKDMKDRDTAENYMSHMKMK